MFKAGEWQSGFILDRNSNEEFGAGLGVYRLTGVVTRLGVPGPYLVCLYERNGGILRRKVYSDVEGNYEFSYIANTTYYVVALDHTGSPVNAAISDYVTPEPMA